MFFFFKQETAYEIVDCDWSSDVCSSDLSEVSTPDEPVLTIVEGAGVEGAAVEGVGVEGVGVEGAAVKGAAVEGAAAMSSFLLPPPQATNKPAISGLRACASLRNLESGCFCPKDAAVKEDEVFRKRVNDVRDRKRRFIMGLFHCYFC